MTTQARGGRAAILVILLRSMALGVTILTGLVSAALLGASGRGVLAALLTGPAFLSGVCSLGLHAAVIYRMKEQPEEARTFFGTALVLALALGVCAVVIGWVAEPFWLHHYDAHVLWFGRLLLLVLPMTIATWTMTGAAESQGWFTFANGTLYLQNCAVLLLLGILAWTHTVTPESAALAYLAPTVPVFIYFAVRMAQRMRPRTPRLWHAKRLLGYGIRLYGVDLLNTFQTYSDQLVAVAFLPPALVGAYSVAQSIARMPVVVSTGVSSVLFPSVAARAQGHVLERVALSFRMVTLATAAVAFSLALAGPYLLILIYGPSFSPAITPLRILLVATVISNGTAILYQAYAASGRPGYITLCECLGLCIGLPLMGVLAAHLGAIGVGVAVLTAAVLRAGSATAGMSLITGARWPRLLPDSRDVRQLGTACAALIARAAP